MSLYSSRRFLTTILCQTLFPISSINVCKSKRISFTTLQSYSTSKTHFIKKLPQLKQTQNPSLVKKVYSTGNINSFMNKISY